MGCKRGGGNPLGVALELVRARQRRARDEVGRVGADGLILRKGVDGRRSLRPVREASAIACAVHSKLARTQARA